MSPKKRLPIRPELADEVIFEADRTCCICKQIRSFQLHHLDGNPSNNTFDNLVLLCLDHHAEASSKSTMARKLSPGVIRKYRNQLLQDVRAKRETVFGRTVDKIEFDAQMEALACHEVRKLALELVGDWKKIQNALERIYPYSSHWEYGDGLRSEVLKAVESLTDRVRHGMPVETARTLESLATNSMPIGSLVVRSHRKPTRVQQELLERGAHTGRSIAYDGVLYCEDLKILDAGTSLLRRVLRFAHLNQLEGLKREALECFEQLFETAKRAEDPKALAWIVFQRDDALALDSQHLPKMPDTFYEISGMPRTFEELDTIDRKG